MCINIFFDKIDMAILPIPGKKLLTMNVGDNYRYLCVDKGGDHIYYFDCVVTTVYGHTVFFTHSGKYGVANDKDGFRFIDTNNTCSVADIRDILVDI